MAKEKDAVPDGVRERTAETDQKLKALTETVGAIAALSRPDRLDVLRAVACLYGLVIPMEPQR